MPISSSGQAKSKENDTMDTGIDYQEYLKSDEWNKIKQNVLEKANFKCEYCGNDAYAVHHIKYPKDKKEIFDNLVAVCRRCHSLNHGIHSEIKKLEKSERIIGKNNKIFLPNDILEYLTTFSIDNVVRNAKNSVYTQLKTIGFKCIPHYQFGQHEVDICAVRDSWNLLINVDKTKIRKRTLRAMSQTTDMTKIVCLMKNYLLSKFTVPDVIDVVIFLPVNENQGETI